MTDDELDKLVDSWSDLIMARIYIQLYRMGMRIDHAEGLVNKPDEDKK